MIPLLITTAHPLTGELFGLQLINFEEVIIIFSKIGDVTIRTIDSQEHTM
jgi:hypothetical protein